MDYTNILEKLKEIYWQVSVEEKIILALQEFEIQIKKDIDIYLENNFKKGNIKNADK